VCYYDKNKNGYSHKYDDLNIAKQHKKHHSIFKKSFRKRLFIMNIEKRFHGLLNASPEKEEANL